MRLALCARASQSSELDAVVAWAGGMSASGTGFGDEISGLMSTSSAKADQRTNKKNTNYNYVYLSKHRLQFAFPVSSLTLGMHSFLF